MIRRACLLYTLWPGKLRHLSCQNPTWGAGEAKGRPASLHQAEAHLLPPNVTWVQQMLQISGLSAGPRQLQQPHRKLMKLPNGNVMLLRLRSVRLPNQPQCSATRRKICFHSPTGKSGELRADARKVRKSRGAWDGYSISPPHFLSSSTNNKIVACPLLAMMKRKVLAPAASMTESLELLAADWSCHV